jgi:AcrR family transcriptional regulator
VFSIRRYDDVTLEELASRSGTSARTIYRLFGTKRKLFTSWLRAGAPGLESLPDPSKLTDVHAFVHLLVEFYEQHGVALLNLLSQEGSVPALRPLIDDGRERYEKGIERALGHMLRGFRGAARRRRHLQLVAICDVYMWSLLRRGKGLCQADVEHVLADMLSILGAAPRPPSRSQDARSPGGRRGAAGARYFG